MMKPAGFVAERHEWSVTVARGFGPCCEGKYEVMLLSMKELEEGLPKALMVGMSKKKLIELGQLLVKIAEEE